MKNSEIFAQAINEYVRQFGTETIMDVDEVLAAGKMSHQKGNILPTDFCYNRYNNGLGEFEGPHLFEYTEDRKFRVLGENFPYTGLVYHKPRGGQEKAVGQWENGNFRFITEGASMDISENVRERRDELVKWIKKELSVIPVTVYGEEKNVLIKFQELLICGVSVEDEGYKIFNASSDWEEQTTYLCDESGDGTWHYYLESEDECIAEAKRLVMFEAKKGSKTPSTGASNNNLTFEVFERAYRDFMVQAEKNAVSGKSQGSRKPIGTDNVLIGPYGLSQHFGQGAASKTPYLNWYVVSIYYLPDRGSIVIGIEEDRYPFIRKMEKARSIQLGNRKTNVAVFYETVKEKLDMKRLFDNFIQVCDEVVRLGTP